jgi:hypothetical protein
LTRIRECYVDAFSSETGIEGRFGVLDANRLTALLEAMTSGGALGKRSAQSPRAVSPG